MSIREKVARAAFPIHFENDWSNAKVVRQEAIDTASEVITAFLEAASEQGWQLVPREATEEMQKTFCVANTPMSAWRFFCKAAPEFEVGE